jgi:DNA-binding NtrC family response regulator
MDALEAAGHRVLAVSSGADLRALMGRATADAIVVVTADARGGIEWIGRARSASDCPVFVIAPAADPHAVVAATKAGATDFFAAEPLDLASLLIALKDAIEARRRERAPRLDLVTCFPGSSPSIQALRRKLMSIAPLTTPILVTGEAGTERDLAVEALHTSGPHAEIPLTEIRCAWSQPDDAPLPARGDVVLRDVDALALETSAAWRDRCARLRAGSAGAALRILATAEAPLASRARSGDFDPELARLLSAVRIDVPPLRERSADLPILALHILRGTARRMGVSPPRLSPGFVRLVRRHGWPGNREELETVLASVLAFARGDVLSSGDLEEALAQQGETVHVLRRERLAEERRCLVAVLRETGGNQTEAARRLGWSRAQVRYRLDLFGLAGPSAEGSRPRRARR